MLNISTLANLSTLLSTVQRNAEVTWLVGTTENPSIRYGTMRHFIKSPDNFGFLSNGDNVLDAYVRITTSEGFEWTPSVMELVDMIHNATMVER